MALSEFVALETAYRALVELDAPARARALAWLTDALATPGVLPQDHSPAAAVEAAGDQPPAAANAAPRARRPARPAASPAVETKPKPHKKAAKGAKKSTTRTPKAPASGPTPAKPERAYRKMPPADEVMGAYRQVGTISGLAEHYQVPVHTIQGWARRLRKEGHTIGRTA